MQSKLRLALAGVVALILVLIPVGTQDPYYMDILIRIGIWVIMVLGLQLMMTADVISNAQVAFMGVGAYTSVLLVMRAGWSFWEAFPLSAIMAGVVAVLVGIPALRTRGVYFVITTIALASILQLVWSKWSNIFGGVIGIRNIPPPSPITFFGHQIQFGYGHRVEYYYLVLIVVAIVAVIVYRLRWSRFGLSCRAIGEAETLARSAGMNAFKYRLIVFALGSCFAGFAGSLQAHYLFFISSDGFDLTGGMYVIVYAVVGGLGSVAGPFLGVASLILVGEALRFLEQWTPLFYGAILVGIMTFLPDGLSGVPRLVSSWFRKPSSAPSNEEEAKAKT